MPAASKRRIEEDVQAFLVGVGRALGIEQVRVAGAPR